MRNFILFCFLLIASVATGQRTYVALGGAANFYGPTAAQGPTVNLALIRNSDLDNGSTNYFTRAEAEFGSYYNDTLDAEVRYVGGSLSIGISDNQFLSGGLRFGYVRNTFVERGRSSGATGSFFHIGFQFEPTVFEPGSHVQNPSPWQRIAVSVPVNIGTTLTGNNVLWGSLGLRLAYRLDPGPLQ